MGHGRVQEATTEGKGVYLEKRRMTGCSKRSCDRRSVRADQGRVRHGQQHRVARRGQHGGADRPPSAEASAGQDPGVPALHGGARGRSSRPARTWSGTAEHRCDRQGDGARTRLTSGGDVKDGGVRAVEGPNRRDRVRPGVSYDAPREVGRQLPLQPMKDERLERLEAIRDDAGDRQRGGRGRGWGVADVQRARRPRRTRSRRGACRRGRSAWARMPAGPASTSDGFKRRDVARRRPRRRPVWRAAKRHLGEAGAPERSGHAPGAGPGQRRARVGAVEGAQRVGAARRGQQRGRAEPDVAVDRLGQVDAEERQRRVRDRVDQAADQVPGVRARASGSCRGTGRSAGRRARRRPRPGGRTRGRRRRRRARPGSRPRRCGRPSCRSERVEARRRTTPVWIVAPARPDLGGDASGRPRRSRRCRSRGSAARRRRRRAARSRRSPTARSRRRPGTPFSRPRRSSSSSVGDLARRPAR